MYLVVELRKGVAGHDHGGRWETAWFPNGQTTYEYYAYYPWGGQPLPMRQGNDLYLLHTDRLGSITNASDASGASVATQRYTAYGSRWATKSSGTMPTDRGFTGQIRDGSRSNFDFYFYRSRYYNASIGKFVQADTIVPDLKNPQALNRYAYGLNNPLKFVDPSGHDAMDPNWVAAFEAAHPGQHPSTQDWEDYQFSLSHSGSGPNGSWTGADWQDYHDTGYLEDRTFYATGNFQLYEPSDTTGINGDDFVHPRWSSGGNLATLPNVNFGTASVRVHERITGTGTHIDVFVGGTAGDSQTLLRPTYSVWIGVPPAIPGAPAQGQLAPYRGAAIRPRTGSITTYAGGIDIPTRSGVVYRLEIDVNPWAPGAFALTGTTTFEFDL